MAKEGRPPIEITPELSAKAESLSSQGLTMEQIASMLGMSDTTLYKKQAEFAEFMESIKRGRAKGIATITNRLFDKAKDGDNTAMIFYLKNRAGWADKVDQQLTVAEGGPLLPPQIIRPVKSKK